MCVVWWCFVAWVVVGGGGWLAVVGGGWWVVLVARVLGSNMSAAMVTLITIA